MKKLVHVFVILSWSFLVTLPGCKEEKLCNVSVEGVLTDSLTGQPVAGIRIVLYAEKGSLLGSTSLDLLDEVTSDAGGQYFMKGSFDCNGQAWMRHFGSDLYKISNKIDLTKTSNTINFRLEQK